MRCIILLLLFIQCSKEVPPKPEFFKVGSEGPTSTILNPSATDSTLVITQDSLGNKTIYLLK